MTNSPDSYIANLVGELDRVVNGMPDKVPVLDRDHKATAQAASTWRIVSLSDRPKLGSVRSGVAYDPVTDSYFVVCHASVGVAPRRFQAFKPALEFARTGRSSGGEPTPWTGAAASSGRTGASGARITHESPRDERPRRSAEEWSSRSSCERERKSSQRGE